MLCPSSPALGKQPQLLCWSQCVARLIQYLSCQEWPDWIPLWKKTHQNSLGVTQIASPTDLILVYWSLNPETHEYLLLNLPFFRLNIISPDILFQPGKISLINISKQRRLFMWQSWEMWDICPWPPAKTLFGHCWLYTDFPGFHWCLKLERSPKFKEWTSTGVNRNSANLSHAQILVVSCLAWVSTFADPFDSPDLGGLSFWRPGWEIDVLVTKISAVEISLGCSSHSKSNQE